MEDKNCDCFRGLISITSWCGDQVSWVAGGGSAASLDTSAVGSHGNGDPTICHHGKINSNGRLVTIHSDMTRKTSSQFTV